MGEAIRPVMDVTAAQTINPPNEDASGSSRSTSCLACATSEAPVVTLVTACVRYLRCSVCGFIWTVSAPEGQAPTE
jgi:formate dehydrogenase maturation protein FdhE